LELGIIPISLINKARRINYYHYLTTRRETEILYNCFVTQFYKPCRGDWTETVKQDLEDFEIPCDFKNIKSKSKDAFKRLVKIKAKEYALKILTAKQQRHTKNENYSVHKAEKTNLFLLGEH
jgi:hypothetical protein